MEKLILSILPLIIQGMYFEIVRDNFPICKLLNLFFTNFRKLYESHVGMGLTPEGINVIETRSVILVRLIIGY